MSIAIDPGHGGLDRGVTDATCGLEEASVVLELAGMLAETVLMLWPDEGRMVLTRDSDVEDPTLAERNNIVERSDADLVISLHCNASRHHDQRGGMVLHWPGNLHGRAVADQIQRSLPIRPVSMNSPPVSRHLWPRAYNVVGAFKRTAVLVEVGYLDRPDEAAQLSRYEVKERVVLAIVGGIAVHRDLRFPW